MTADLHPTTDATMPIAGVRGRAGATQGGREIPTGLERVPRAQIATGSRCACAACGRAFSDGRAFDSHRRDVKGVGTCIEPATLGMRASLAGAWRAS